MASLTVQNNDKKKKNNNNDNDKNNNTSINNNNKDNITKINNVNKYRKQLLKWKNDKLNDFKNNKKNIQEKYDRDIDIYDGHLTKKIYNKLLQKVLLIQPSDITNENVTVDLGFCEDEYKGSIKKMIHTHTNKNWVMWDGGHVGGKPIWLNPNKKPSKKQLACNVCGANMLFLLQLYAPIDDEIHKPNAFHRTIYAFCCKNEKCLKKGGHNGFRIIRSQLPRKNDIYPYDEFNDERTIFDNDNEHDTNCLDTFQFKIYEIMSELETDCLKDANAAITDKFKDVIEEQVQRPKKAKEEEEEEEEEEDVAITQNDIDNVMNAICVSDVKKKLTGDSNSNKSNNTTIVSKSLDKSMTYFHYRIDIAKDQILRYARWQPGEELFCSDTNRPNVLETIPKCPYCNGLRQFEFQIMPQLLSYLNIENVTGPGEIDWGGLYIYTCVNSCGYGGEEYIWCQTPC